MTWESHTDRLSILGMMFVAGWMASSAANNVQELWKAKGELNYVKAVEVPKLKDVAGCQTKRAQIATQQAALSEAGGDVNLSDIPNCPKLPPPLVRK